MKKGISLIVLVITIIVMIILAASVVITLSNTGVINRASQAVDLTNEAAVQDLAALVWAECYLDPVKKANMANSVKTELANQGITEDKWNINVTETGVTIKQKYKGDTLGSLIANPLTDYGKKVNYSVTIDGTVHNDWRVYYEDVMNGYVFLIATTNIGYAYPDTTSVLVSELTDKEKELFNICTLGRNSELNNLIAYMIRNYGNYANTTDYGEYVVGALGGATLEMLCASAEQMGLNIPFDTSEETIDDIDGLYIGGSGWLLTAAGYDSLMLTESNYITSGTGSCGLRPLICLRADTPAQATSDGYSIIK